MSADATPAPDAPADGEAADRAPGEAADRAPGEASEAGTTRADRNRTTVRRALRAGAGAAMLAAAAMVALVMTSSLPGAAVPAAAIAAWGLVVSAWLLLAALLDVLAGEPPDRRRVLWTAVATLVALLGPFLLLGAVFQPVATGGG